MDPKNIRAKYVDFEAVLRGECAACPKKTPPSVSALRWPGWGLRHFRHGLPPDAIHVDDAIRGVVSQARVGGAARG
jgi:hypothetical protein